MECPQRLLSPDEIRALVWQQARRWLSRYYSSASVEQFCDRLWVRFYYGTYYVEVVIDIDRVTNVIYHTMDGREIERWERQEETEAVAESSSQ